ncbi:MAG: hypothetical protein WCJ56_14265 [bacterium]
MVEELVEPTPAEPIKLAGKHLTPIQSTVLGLVLYLLFFIGITGFNELNLEMPLAMWFIVPILVTVGYLVIVVNAIRMMCRLSLTSKQETTLMLVSLLLYIMMNSFLWGFVKLLTTADYKISSNTSPFIVALHAFSSKYEYFLDQLPVWGFIKPLDVIEPFLLIIVGVFFGQLLSRMIKERAILIPVAVVSSMVDFWGVYWGPVAAMSVNMPELVGKVGSVATVATAAPTTGVVAQQIQTAVASSPVLKILANVAPPTTIGLGDFVFLAFFLTCAWKLGFSTRRTMWGIFVGQLISSILMALQGMKVLGHEISIEYLPGLPFICGGAVFANLKVWKLSKQEWLMTGVLAILLGGLIGVTAWRKAAEGSIVIPPVQYIISATSASEAIRSTIALGQEQTTKTKAAGTDFILLQVQARISKGENGIAVDSFTLLALGRKPNIENANDTWDQIFFGRPTDKDPSKWVIRQDAVRPASKANELAQAIYAAKSPDELEGARKAVGITSELELLEHLDDYAEQIGDATTFDIEIYPGKAVMRTKKSGVQELVLPGVKPTPDAPK